MGLVLDYGDATAETILSSVARSVSGTTACANTPGDRNLLDFMDETVMRKGARGRLPGWLRRTCVTNPTGAHPNSYTALASIARQSGAAVCSRHSIRIRGAGCSGPTSR